jgi:hypothetical protein
MDLRAATSAGAACRQGVGRESAGSRPHTEFMFCDNAHHAQLTHDIECTKLNGAVGADDAPGHSRQRAAIQLLSAEHSKG